MNIQEEFPKEAAVMRDAVGLPGQAPLSLNHC